MPERTSDRSTWGAPLPLLSLDLWRRDTGGWGRAGKRDGLSLVVGLPRRARQVWPALGFSRHFYLMVRPVKLDTAPLSKAYNWSRHDPAWLPSNPSFGLLRGLRQWWLFGPVPSSRSSARIPGWLLFLVNPGRIWMAGSAQANLCHRSRSRAILHSLASTLPIPTLPPKRKVRSFSILRYLLSAF